MTTKTLANREIVVLAVYLLGGDLRHVDTEDVAVKANELAPGRFTWRKYPGQINIDTVRKRLWEAKTVEKGALLAGSEKRGWILTEQGVEFVGRAIRQVEGLDLSGERLTPGEVRWRQRQRVRLLASEAFAKYCGGRVDSITKQDLEAFFMVDDYTEAAARTNRVLRVRRAFEADPDLGEAVRALAALLVGGGENSVG